MVSWHYRILRTLFEIVLLFVYDELATLFQIKICVDDEPTCCPQHVATIFITTFRS